LRGLDGRQAVLSKYVFLSILSYCTERPRGKALALLVAGPCRFRDDWSLIIKETVRIPICVIYSSDPTPTS